MAVTLAEVTEVYIATFDRAPDADGLDYWVNAGLTIEEIAEYFFDQNETRDLYPDLMDNRELINTIYQNLFNRDADEGGMTYWLEYFDSGAIARNDAIIEIIHGAKGEDKVILDNKTEVGLYFVTHGEDLSIKQAYEVMDDVDGTQKSVDAAEHQVDEWNGSGPGPNPGPDSVVPITVDLTTLAETPAGDHIVGTNLDDTINGFVQNTVVGGVDQSGKTTLNTIDTINGGGDWDTLAVEYGGGTELIPLEINMSNVETLALTSKSWYNALGNGAEIDLAQTTGLQEIIVGGQPAGVQISNVKNIVDLTLEGVNTNNFTGINLSYDTGVLSGNDDSMEITSNLPTGAIGAQVSILSDGVLENINYHLEGAGVTMEFFAHDGIKAITVDGVSNDAINTKIVDSSGTVELFDLSETTGVGLYVEVANTSGATVISGGGGDFIDLNSGEDSVEYTKADQSDAVLPDIIWGFDLAKDKFVLSKAVDNATGNATNAAIEGLIVQSATELTDGMGMGVAGATATVGKTNVYVDFNTGAGNIYIDMNQDGIYQAASDMVIQTNVTDMSFTYDNFVG